RSMFWSTAAVPSETLSQRGAAVAAKMTAGASVRVTSAAGTNLRLTLDTKAVRLNTGRTADNALPSGPAQAFLPAGDARVCGAPASATGARSAPSHNSRGAAVPNVHMVYNKGVVASIPADSGADQVKAYFASAGAASAALSLIDIGLNPQSHMIDGST